MLRQTPSHSSRESSSRKINSAGTVQLPWTLKPKEGRNVTLDKEIQVEFPRLTPGPLICQV